MPPVHTVVARALRFGLSSLSFRRMFPRCQSDRCASKGTLWPAIRHRSSGIHLEGRWLCSPACFEQAVATLLAQTVPLRSRWKPKPHRMPIGLVLLSRGMIRDDQLRQALEQQREAGGPLGPWLQLMGAVTEDDLTSALAAQWSCPVFPLAGERNFLECPTMLPLDIIQAARMLPVYSSRDQSSVYLAFVDGIDHTWLRAAEQMIGCPTVPCLVTESAFRGAVSEISSMARPEEFSFDSVKEIREMSRITTSFALQLQAKSAHLVACREFVWVRFDSTDVARHLVFRLPIAGSTPALARPRLKGSEFSPMYQPG
jgi:hypothetical protein